MNTTTKKTDDLAGRSPAGERLRDARRAAGLSLAEVAARLGVGVSSLAEYERNKTPNVATALRLAALLGADPFALYLGEAPPKPKTKYRRPSARRLSG